MESKIINRPQSFNLKKFNRRGINKNFLIFLVILFAVSVFRDVYSLAFGEESFDRDSNSVRIAIFQDLDEFDISVRGEYKILDAVNKRILDEGWVLRDRKVKIRAEQTNGIRIGLKNYPVNKLTIAPTFDATVYINQRRFSGAVNIIRTADQKLLLVNVVGLEAYIKGVLYHEVSHRWPMDALKSQAVAARSYAIYRMQNSADKDFDVTNDIYSQVYGGKTSERYRTNLAVEWTKNQVLTYAGKILPAYFHATCAGHTENVSELWKQDILPLKGVFCPYCKNSPHYNWKQNFRLKDIQDKLNAAGYKIGLIQDIRIVERNRSNRIRKLLITDRQGESLAISGKDFRNLVGPNLIRSNNYDIEMKGYFFDMNGHGWGHGVGLCQWGADEMARQHYKYDEILNFYYPAAKIEMINDHMDWNKNKIFSKKILPNLTEPLELH